ncbi:MAG: hypothetical protein B7Y99_12980 [Caulobacterales bacterium 32-69-10]|nr:MAG: hypothetical protein B7Y99_12980 [Caulobacterales bacterium 32-69-10]
MMTPTDDVAAKTQAGDEALLAGDPAKARALYLEALAQTNHRRRSGLVARLGFVGHHLGAALLEIQRTIEAQGHTPVFVSDGMAVWHKSNAFVQQPAFLSVVEKHAYLLPLPNWHWNLQTVLWAVLQARSLAGDFVELGVFRGHTTAVTAEHIRFASWNRRWYLYDTFNGIPEDQLNVGWSGMNETAYKGTYSYEEVRDRFAAYPNIDVIKGRVPEIFQEVCPQRIAFLHMDLNSAVAEIAALEQLYDRIVSSNRRSSIAAPAPGTAYRPARPR